MIFSINNTGSQRRNLDSKYPPWQTVFYTGRHSALLNLNNEEYGKISLIQLFQMSEKGKEEIDTPSLLAIDSQSGRRCGFKKVQFTNEETGIDGGKNVNGRKRTILVDTLGLPWSIKVTAGNFSDNQAGILAIDSLAGKVPRLKKITADAGYKLAFKEHIETNYQWKVEVTQKPESTKGFIPQK